MSLAEYVVDKMIENPDNWTFKVDVLGLSEIVNHKGASFHGVREKDGTMVSIDTIMEMYNKKIEKEA